jgi:hypothetical protein
MEGKPNSRAERRRLMRLVKTLCAAGTLLLFALFPALASAAPAADLSVAMSGRPDPVIIHGVVTWTITVRNLGPGDASRVQLVVHYGSDANAVSADTSQGTCVHTGGFVTFSMGTLPSGGTATATFLDIDFGGDGGRLWATVSSTTSDPVAANNSADERVTTIRVSPPPPVTASAGAFCPPSGGVDTGRGGAARGSIAGLVTVALLGAAGLMALAARFVRR